MLSLSHCLFLVLNNLLLMCTLVRIWSLLYGLQKANWDYGKFISSGILLNDTPTFYGFGDIQLEPAINTSWQW